MSGLASDVGEIRSVLADQFGADTAVLIQKVADSQPLIVENADEPFEAASLAKLPIALTVLDELLEGNLDREEPLLLGERHKRSGTGVLKHLPSGLPVTVDQALGLMLVESDTTAANLLLERLGGPGVVNQHLANLTIEHSGLANRDDAFFESTQTTAYEVLRIIQALDGRTEIVTELLHRSHFRYGLRRVETGRPTVGTETRLKIDSLGAQLIGRVGIKRLCQNLINFRLGRYYSQMAATKEGSLDDQQHEAGLITSTNRIYVVAMSKGFEQPVYDLSHPAKVGFLAPLGRAILRHTQYH
ncbi:serine hydrolase [Candidatus Microgenomates bacterium]|nr:serine hydrolase [Candidatus Microgenomates bacterium]